MKYERMHHLRECGRLIGYTLLIGVSFITHFAYAKSVTFNPPKPGSDFTDTGIENLTITTTWDDSLACQGSTTTILFNISLKDPGITPLPDGVPYPLYFQGFVPVANGFACPLVIPPAPTGILPNGSFSTTATPIVPDNAFLFNLCPQCTNTNLGVWALPNPLPNLTSGFDMSVTVTLTECGTVSYTPCLYLAYQAVNGPQPFVFCVATITFSVVPHAEVEDVVVGPVCQGTTFTGTLPPPICTAQLGFQCPNCIPCTACSGFTFTTAATACSQCSGQTSCFCPCTACSGYTGCPPCTACVHCTGCTACGGYTGPCGPQPMNFTVGNAVGGTVTLTDPTGGVFAFVPNASFFGTASFQYNVVSDWNPIVFCPAVTAGLFEITYAQAPVTPNETITGCAGTGITGSLAPFVTGGSGSYTFSQTGPVSCGSVTVNPDGTFTFISPSGVGTTCNFIYAATDNTPPNCVGTGVVSVTVNPLPTAVSTTISTCINTSTTSTVTATGGTSPYTFAIVTFPADGTLTLAADFATSGNFTYTPNLNFTGTDSFTFSATDANGCTSDPDGIITINLDPIPIAGSTSVNGCVNTTLNGSLVSLVTGGSGPLSFSGPLTTPTCGGVFIQSDGSYTFAPNFGFTGLCCFTYGVSQGGCAATAPGQVCVNVQNGPIATGSTFNVCPSGTVTGNLNDNVISGNPPNPNTFTIVGAPFGGFFDSFSSTTGDYTFTTTNATGQAGFNFQVNDGFPCSSATETVLITIHPKPTTKTGTLQACSNAAVAGNLNSQVMGDGPFTFTGPITESGGTVVIDHNGLFDFSPAPGATGGSFTYGVASSFGCTGVGTELIVIHPAPSATGETVTGCSQSQITGSLSPLVSGGTPPYVNFQLAGVPIGGSALVNSNGNFTFTPNGSVSPASFEYQVTDSNGCTDTATITVGVNRGPTAPTGNFTGCNGGVEGSLIDIVSGVAPFTFMLPVGPVFNGTVTLLNPANGTFVFVPTFPAPTQGSFDYQVTDSSVPPCTSRPTPVFVNIVVGPQANPASFTGCENQTLSGSLAPFVTGGIPPYSFSFTGAVPACASLIEVLSDGEFTFVPAFNFTGPCIFDYCVTDTIPCTDCSTVTVNVQPSPVATNSGPFTGCVDNPFSGNLNDFMASGTPPFSFASSFVINGVLNLLVTGPFTFTPSSIGFASFDYSAVDFYGCQSNIATISFNAQESPTITGTSPLDTCQGTPVTGTVTAASSVGLMPLTFSIAPGSEVKGTATVTQTSPTTASFTFTPNVTVFPTPTVIGHVTIRVTASNGCYGDFPVTINIHQSPIAGSTGLGSCSPVFTGSLTGLVSGGVPPYIFSQFNGFVPPACGTVAIAPSGTFVFTAGGTGPCTFFYQVTESSASACASTGAVTITTSIPPAVTDFTTCACFNVPVSINLNTLTSGGVPPYTFAIVGTPVGGTVFLNPITGIATFIPTPGFNGVGSFQFQAFDSFNPPCASNIGTVTIPVPCC